MKRIAITFLLAGMVSAITVFAQSITDSEVKLVADDGSSSDNLAYFGATAMDGNYIIAGAYSADINSANSAGAAYIFYFDGTNWSQQQKLVASDGEADDWLGSSVGISGDYCIVGAPAGVFNSTTPGAAYIYQRSGTAWSEVAILEPTDGNNEDNFGKAVDIYGDYAIVSAPYNVNDTGAVYLYQNNGTSWEYEGRILPSGLDESDYFGNSLDINGDIMIIGAAGDDDGATDGGAAYIYRLNGSTWEFEQKILADTPSEVSDFGYFVSVDGDRAVVATPGYNQYLGKIFVYKYDGTAWNFEAGITEDHTASNGYGYSAKILGDYIIVGVHQADSAKTDNGAAVIYEYNGTTWSIYEKFSNTDPAYYKNFGSSVAITNGKIAVGAYSDNLAEGAVYVYDLETGSGSGTAPSAAFTASTTSGEAPLSVTFTDQSTGTPTDWAWDFDNDGSVDATDQNPTHVYTDPWTYSVSLIVANETATDELVKTNYITVNEGGGGNTSGEYIMSSESVTTDGGTFYDPGGSENYAANSDVTQTFFPATTGNVLQFAFSEFDIEPEGACGFDYLEVYDGTSTSATLIGRFCNGNPVNSLITATNNDGALTFVFHSDFSSEYAGWVAGISSIPPGTATSEYIMSDGSTVTTDNGYFYDNGGLADYSNDAYESMTFYPETAGNMLQFTFSVFDVEQDTDCAFDYLEVYDGTSTSATLIGKYCNGNPVPSVITATNTDGALTFVFSSDGYLNYAGWVAQIASVASGGGSAPVADFTATNASGIEPLTVDFFDLTSNVPTSWAWDFNNDGTTDATEQNPSYTYTAAGTYSVKLTVSNAAGSDEIIKTDFVVVTPAGSGSDESESNDTWETADAVTIDTDINASCGVDTDYNDWFAITTPYDGKLTITVVPAAGLDTGLELWDTNGTRYLKSCDQCGSTGGNDVLTYNNLMAGTYYVRVFANSGSGTYVLSNAFNETELPTGNDVEPNDDADYAIVLTPGSTTTGHMGYYKDNYTDSYDWYAVTTPYDGQLMITATSESTLDMALELWDVNKTRYLRSCTSCGDLGENDTLVFENLKAGTYYIRTYGGYTYGSYTISTEFTATAIPDGNDTEPNDDVSQAIDIPVNTETTGHLGYYQDNSTDSDDWYSVTLPYDGSLIVSTTSESTLDSGLELWDVNETRYLRSCTICGDAGENDTLVYENLMAGTYFIRIYGGYGSYTLKAGFEATELPEGNDAEPNDTYDNAIELTSGVDVTGHIGYYQDNYTDDYDWYSIFIEGESKLTVVADPGENLDIAIELYHTNGSTYMSGCDMCGGTGENDTLLQEIMYPGTYYLRIVGTGYGSYTLLAEVSTESEPLSVDFTATPVSGTAPLTVNFTADAPEATSWAWDFNDDGTVDANEENPSFTFTGEGYYDVRLTVSDGSSDATIMKTDFITVYASQGGEPSEAIGWVSKAGPETIYGDFYTVHFPSKMVGYAGGSRYQMGSILWKTTDGGENWEMIDNYYDETEYSINGIFFLNETSGFIAGGDYYNALLLRTTDGGATWTEPTTNPLNVAIADIHFVNATTGYAVSYYGDVIKTTDGGENWVLQTSGTSESLTDIEFVDENTGWVVGDNGTILKTTDGGATWSAQTSELFWQMITDISAVDASTAYAVAYSNLIKTTDGGATWESVDYSDQVDGGFSEVQFLDANTGWFSASDGKIIHTTDGCTTFSYQESDVNNQLQAIFMLDANYGWSVGGNGDIVRTTNGGISGASVTVKASFIADVTSGDAPLAVQFTDTSEGDISSWEWDFDNDGTVDATDQNPSHTYTDPGSYTVKLVVSDGVATDDTIVESYITVTEVASGVEYGSIKMMIYPNPADDHTFITLVNTAQKINQVQVIALNGEVVIHQVVKAQENQIKIDLTNLASGVYFIKAIDGKQSYIEKLVVK